MATTSINHVTLTVSTVEVFANTMKYINENNLWDDAKSHLAAKGKTEIFVDYDAFHMLREFLTQQDCFDAKDPLLDIIALHNDPFDELRKQMGQERKT